MSYTLVAAGLFLLLLGGEMLVRGSVSLAERLGVPKLIIGLTIVAIGTSAPELVVSVKAALDGVPGIALGNVVGSNIANIVLVLGLPALIYPLYCDLQSMRRDGILMVAATLLFVAMCLHGTFSTVQGTILLSLTFVYLWYSYMRTRRNSVSATTVAEVVTEEIEHHMPRSLWASVPFTIVGIVALIVGSRMLINGATDIARTIGLSDTVIGITLVAIGTSLPELATGVVAALRRHGEVAVGNAIGSNLFNILAIMGTAALVAPIPVEPKVLRFDIWVMVACSVLIFPFALTNRPIGRVAGAAFLIAFVAYITAQFHGMSGVGIAASVTAN